jgi:hypothetical protein
MERVLLETGVGGITALHNYYQEYVLKYEDSMKKKVEEMMEKQRQLEFNACSIKYWIIFNAWYDILILECVCYNQNNTCEFYRMVLDEAASKLQFEELDEFGQHVYREVPTLQLLDPEMGFPPSLDAGFQMLYSLEQDE